jgi:hypothetical protein
MDKGMRSANNIEYRYNTHLDVYVRYGYEEDAGKAVNDLNQRFYAGISLH